MMKLFFTTLAFACWAIASASTLRSSQANSTPNLKAGNFKVDYTIRPVGFVFKDLEMKYHDWGCGSDNSKCTCTYDEHGNLRMKGVGTDGTATGLTFGCAFTISGTPCELKVDIPWGAKVNHLNLVNCDGFQFIGSIPDSGHDFTKTFAIMPAQ